MCIRDSRKNVLKYDEVMNEQRKVIYQRRDQILQDGDLRESTLENLADLVEATIEAYTGQDGEEWDLEGMIPEIATIWPSELTAEQLRECHGTDELYDTLMGEATGHYEEREEEFTPEVMRAVERQVMLRLVDQNWREHLQEMDFLEEGIHLRAMGQKDPLVEWQREGFEMFGLMMGNIARDHVKYVMHVQVVAEDQNAPDPSQLAYSAPEDPSSGGGSMSAAARAQAAADGVEAPPEAEEEIVQQPIVKSEQEKLGRNDPCYCGSGKKFKNCHGAA